MGACWCNNCMFIALLNLWTPYYNSDHSISACLSVLLPVCPSARPPACFLSSHLVAGALIALELLSGPPSQVLPVLLLWDLTDGPQDFSVKPQNLLSL